jgi:HEAT repeat protein
LRLRDQGTRPKALVHLGQLADYLHTHGEKPELVKRVVKLLIPYLKDGDGGLRVAAVSGMPAHEDARAALENVLLDADSAVRQSAFQKLQQLGVDVMPKLQAKLEKAKGREQLRIAAAIYSFTNVFDAPDALAKALKSKDPDIRLEAAHLLVESSKTKPWPDTYQLLVPVLVEGLKSKQPSQREQSARDFAKLRDFGLFLLGGLSPPQPQPFEPELPPLLLPFVDDPSPTVRLHLLQAIGFHEFGADARANLKKLLPNLGDKDDEIRYLTIVALGPVHDLDVADLARLAEKDPSPKVWQQACWQLAKIRPPAKSAVPALLRAAQDEARFHDASRALAEIDNAGTFVRLLELKMGRDNRLNDALGKLDGKETSVGLAGALVRELKLNNPARRRDAAHALRAIIPLLPTAERTETDLSVVKALQGALAMIEMELKSKDPKVRIEAATTLAEFSKLERASSPILRLFLHDYRGRPTGTRSEMKLYAEAQQLWPPIKKLIAIARVDSELQVRRLARQLQRQVPHYEQDVRPSGGYGFFGPSRGGLGNVPLDGFNVPPLFHPFFNPRQDNTIPILLPSFVPGAVTPRASIPLPPVTP